MTVLSRSAIVVKSKFLVAFLVLWLCLLDFSVGVTVFAIDLSQSSSISPTFIFLFDAKDPYFLTNRKKLCSQKTHSKEIVNLPY